MLRRLRHSLLVGAAAVALLVGGIVTAPAVTESASAAVSTLINSSPYAHQSLTVKHRMGYTFTLGAGSRTTDAAAVWIRPSSCLYTSIRTAPYCSTRGHWLTMPGYTVYARY